MSPVWLPAALAAVAFVAGVIDAIAGGGGLLTLPALLFALEDPSLALGTNKGQSVFGSGASLASYARAGHVDRARVVPSFVGALAGALVGVRLVLFVRPTLLRPIVLGLLIAVAAYLALRPPRAAKANAPAAPPRFALALTIAFCLGVYDGFFGPGMGTLLIAAYTAAFGDDLTHATANAKVANFASNLGGVAAFAAAGSIVWRLSLPMALGQSIGSAIGAHVAVRGGERLVRVAVLGVTVAIVAKLAIDTLR